ncbi:hypothetical protein DPMN_164027 [Dreissena polymorpha]|uniref:G-protein coupled receptors family 1 profile domain-containing protein n=1 Tax=Dreissena polymorpha TaxID=45954 RepID=A0A9D4IRZ2_DREPO|nr:hypothetical protein DPMN_164027 [Dreissena polymorpha]
MACSGDQMGKSFICIGNGSQSKSFFTFYSQFNRNWGGEGVLEAVVMLILAIMSVPGNLVICVFILKSKTTRTVTNVLVCNLALADIAFCLSAPFVAYVRVHGTWTLEGGMCRVLMYWMNVCGVVMIWTLTAISIDRYVNIRVGVSSSRKLRKLHLVGICSLIWIVSLLFFLPFAIYFEVKEGVTGNSQVVQFCTLDWPRERHFPIIYTALIALFCFFIPVNIITISYYRIFQTFWKSRRAVGSFSRNAKKVDSTNAARQSKQQKVVRTLVLIVLVFIAMWLPLFIVIALVEYDVSNHMNGMHSNALIWAVIFAYGNSLANAIMYGSVFVQLWNAVFRCCRRKIIPGENETVNIDARTSVHHVTTVTNL